MRSQPSDRDVEFARFVAARQSHLRRIALAVCRDPHRAEDVLQTALVKLYLAWPRVRRDGGEEAYARRIIVRADIDELRRPWRRREHPLGGEHDTASEPGLTLEDQDALYSAVRRLPDMQRRVVLLRHWLGLSLAETAADLGISQGTVKSHTSRALASLRQQLGPEMDPREPPGPIRVEPSPAVRHPAPAVARRGRPAGTGGLERSGSPSQM